MDTVTLGSRADGGEMSKDTGDWERIRASHSRQAIEEETRMVNDLRAAVRKLVAVGWSRDDIIQDVEAEAVKAIIGD